MVDKQETTASTASGETFKNSSVYATGNLSRVDWTTLTLRERKETAFRTQRSRAFESHAQNVHTFGGAWRIRDPSSKYRETLDDYGLGVFFFALVLVVQIGVNAWACLWLNATRVYGGAVSAQDYVGSNSTI